MIAVMSRVAQPDLFAPVPAACRAAPEPNPVAELETLLEKLLAADALPWADAAAVMAEEHRALGLAQLAGPRGAQLAAAILGETERLLAAAEGRSRA